MSGNNQILEYLITLYSHTINITNLRNQNGTKLSEFRDDVVENSIEFKWCVDNLGDPVMIVNDIKRIISLTGHEKWDCFYNGKDSYTFFFKEKKTLFILRLRVYND